MFVVDVCVITVSWGIIPFLCLGFYIVFWAFVVVLPIALLTLQSIIWIYSILWVLISVIVLVMFVGSRGPRSQICYFVGVVVGVLPVIVWVLVRPFTMFVRGLDVNKHTQHKTARMARDVGNSRGEGCYIFACVCFFYWLFAPGGISNIVCCRLCMAGPFALRRREFVRHAAASPPWVARTRASLWLLLTGGFCQKR
jgi:hypothetical protein